MWHLSQNNSVVLLKKLQVSMSLNAKSDKNFPIKKKGKQNQYPNSLIKETSDETYFSKTTKIDKNPICISL